MEKNVLSDRIAGTLFGAAMGSALGQPGEGHTPYLIMHKFNFIDAFCGQAPGQYAPEMKYPLFLANCLQKTNGNLTEVSASFSQEIAKDTGKRGRLLSAIPIGLLAAARGLPDKELGQTCKTILGEGLSKNEFMAIFSIAHVIRECIRNRAALAKPNDLFDADASLLARLVKICSSSESRMTHAPEDPMSERLGFVRSKLMTRGGAPKNDMARFAGLNGISEKYEEAVSFSIYSFLNSPDEFKTVCKAVSLGGASSLNGALVGALVGAYSGVSLLPKDMKEHLQNGVRIEGLATAMAETLWSAGV